LKIVCIETKKENIEIDDIGARSKKRRMKKIE
jgi:hypothetical protein